METEAFDEKTDWAKTHKHPAILSTHSLFPPAILPPK